MGEIRGLARRAGVPVRQVARERLDAVAEDVPHNGCGARGAPVSCRQLTELVREPSSRARLLLLDSVNDPHNLGAVVRTAAAFAIDGLVIAGPSAPPLGGVVAKAAAGCLERLPLARVTVAGDALRELREAGYWVLGADAKGRPVAEVEPTERWVLCLGAEERGLRAKTRSRVDELVSVPLAEGVESLNLSVAAGVLLYELTR
jgi:23S rRNA (guanosine2251-2'-O)-methyltransferase